MKVLLNCHTPFPLAHGGAQIQIERTKAALEKIGIQVEPLRWWDETQTGDVLHHFARIPTDLLQMAHRKGLKVVLADLLTEQGSRSRVRHRFQQALRLSLGKILPPIMARAIGWESYRLAEACVALTAWEAQLMTELYGAPRERIHVVPNGVEDIFFQNAPGERGKWLVCTAVITQRKRVLELGRAAVIAKTPVWIVGKPYSETDPYAREFFELAKNHSDVIRYEGPINDRATLARIYREARGFILLSTMESLSLSALEAAACGCPLLLSDLPWARHTFKDQSQYCPIDRSSQATAAVLRRFYDIAPSAPAPPRPASWEEIARQLKSLYESL
jgi:glycosyltransferase involved in cell wall biosynthesis